jgi:hypothetical protein
MSSWERVRTSSVATCLIRSFDHLQLTNFIISAVDDGLTVELLIQKSRTPEMAEKTQFYSRFPWNVHLPLEGISRPAVDFSRHAIDFCWWQNFERHTVGKLEASAPRHSSLLVLRFRIATVLSSARVRANWRLAPAQRWAITVKTSNFGPQLKFKPSLGIALASLDELDTKNEQTRICKSTNQTKFNSSLLCRTLYDDRKSFGR